MEKIYKKSINTKVYSYEETQQIFTLVNHKKISLIYKNTRIKVKISLIYKNTSKNKSNYRIIGKLFNSPAKEGR